MTGISNVNVESTATKKSDSRPALVRSYVNKPDVVGKLSSKYSQSRTELLKPHELNREEIVIGQVSNNTKRGYVIKDW
jgi:hypothetical protein